MMISDETFPMIDIDEEDFLYNDAAKGDTLTSTETFETSASSSGVVSTADLSNSTCGNKSAKTSQTFFESSGYSFENLPPIKKLTFEPSSKGVKQKKSFSCHDLQQKKPNYEHIQSVVKKEIMRHSMTLSVDIEERRRKVLSRHKSMPLTTQQTPPLDETYSEDPSTLMKELRKKSVLIYELQEKNEEKDSRIYALEYERSKMRLTFDKLRLEMHELKEKEKSFHHLQSVSPPMKLLKNISTQTEPASDLSTSHIRELTFNDTTVFLNQTDFSEMNNASSDNLIPEASLDLNNVTRVVEAEQASDEAQDEQKQKKKLRGIFKLMSCVSK